MTADARRYGRQRRLDGRYRLIEQLGRGGSATVWRGFDERLGRTVAVKIVNQGAACPAGARAEAERLARLNHPHIAQVFDIGSVGGATFLVMEYVEGRTLSDVMADGGLSRAAAIACLAQVSGALAAAHARGLVHRDVTPANVMVTAAGAKLIDFGLSAVEGDPELDADGGLRGTPAYVAPERLRNQAVAPAADVYSAGLVLYRALTGHLPWQASNARQLWAMRESMAPQPLPEQVPPEVGEACLRCLAAEAGDRPDAAELHRVLQSAAGAEAEIELARAVTDTAVPATIQPTQVMAAPAITRERWRRRPLPVAVAGALLLMAAAGWSATNWDPMRHDSITTGARTAPTCAVTYTLAADQGQRFHAAIAATGQSEALPAGWRLSLQFPIAGMNVDDTGGWHRQASTLTSAPQPAVAPGDSAALAIAGSHAGTVALPANITVDGHRCDVVLLDSFPQPAAGAPGVPPALAPPATPDPHKPTGPKPPKAKPNDQGDNG
jgi:eukaryotic-like serine/threonine-protein kinase